MALHPITSSIVWLRVSNLTNISCIIKTRQSRHLLNEIKTRPTQTCTSSWALLVRWCRSAAEMTTIKYWNRLVVELYSFTLLFFYLLKIHGNNTYWYTQIKTTQELNIHYNHIKTRDECTQRWKVLFVACRKTTLLYWRSMQPCITRKV